MQHTAAGLTFPQPCSRSSTKRGFYEYWLRPLALEVQWTALPLTLGYTAKIYNFERTRFRPGPDLLCICKWHGQVVAGYTDREGGLLRLAQSSKHGMWPGPKWVTKTQHYGMRCHQQREDIHRYPSKRMYKAVIKGQHLPPCEKRHSICKRLYRREIISSCPLT